MKIFGRQMFKMLMAAEGGGGGGATKTPEELAAEDEARWNERFHKASTEREKRFKAALVKEMSGVLETQFGAKFDELRKILVESPEDKEDRPQPGERGAGKLSPEAEAMIRQSQKDAKEAKDLAKKWESEATAEKQRASKNEERQALLSQLNGKVKPALLDMVVDQLHSKHLTRDPESGAILWKDEDGATLPLKEAIATWAKSDVGKEFAAPRDVRGTGGRGPAEGNSGGDRTPGSMTMEKLGDVVLGSIPGQR